MKKKKPQKKNRLRMRAVQCALGFLEIVAQCWV